jgi:hypothetical protein
VEDRQPVGTMIYDQKLAKTASDRGARAYGELHGDECVEPITGTEAVSPGDLDPTYATEIERWVAKQKLRGPEAREARRFVWAWWIVGYNGARLKRCDKPPATKPVSTIDEVERFVKSLRTWFEVHEKGPDEISYDTREHGDMENDRAGREDVLEARRVVEALRKQYGEQLSVKAETVDEWVMIEIKVNR